MLLKNPAPLSARGSHNTRRMHPGEAHLTVGVVEYTTPYKRKKRGLCSTYLASLKPGHASTPGHASITENGHGTGGHAAGDRVAVWVERGALRMPASMATPLILIGPGTGEQGSWGN